MSFSFMVRTSLIYFCWVGKPQLQIYQGVFILSIAKAFFPLAKPVVVLRKTTNPNVSPIGKRFGFECFGASDGT